jgi:hypothetical protein
LDDRPHIEIEGGPPTTRLTAEYRDFVEVIAEFKEGRFGK